MHRQVVRQLAQIRSLRLPHTRRREVGQGLVEYALILVLVAIVVIVALQFLGGQVSGLMHTVGNSV
jgi:pilus assembly protein Flp/PilA